MISLQVSCRTYWRQLWPPSSSVLMMQLIEVRPAAEMEVVVRRRRVGINDADSELLPE